MIVVPFSPEHYREVDWSRMTEGVILGTMEHRWLVWALKRTETSWGFTGLEEGRTVGSAGLFVLEKGVGGAWVLFTPQARERGVKVLRLLRRGLENLAINLGLQRIQARVRADAEKARKLVEHLGFEEEAVMHGFGPDQADYLLYVRRR